MDAAHGAADAEDGIRLGDRSVGARAAAAMQGVDAPGREFGAVQIHAVDPELVHGPGDGVGDEVLPCAVEADHPRRLIGLRCVTEQRVAVRGRGETARPEVTPLGRRAGDQEPVVQQDLETPFVARLDPLVQPLAVYPESCALRCRSRTGAAPRFSHPPETQRSRNRGDRVSGSVNAGGSGPTWMHR